MRKQVRRTPSQETKPADTRVVAAYIRVSSQRQVSEGDSLEAQQNLIAAAVARDYGVKAEEIRYYVDAGKSAKDQNRPELQRLRRDVRNGDVRMVVVYKLDRITRSLQDFTDLWSLFREHHVEIISLQERFDTTMPAGQAMLQIIMVFAELERKLVAERTRSVMLDRIERGLTRRHMLTRESESAGPKRGRTKRRLGRTNASPRSLRARVETGGLVNP